MYRRKSDGWLKHWDFILLELICLQGSFILAYFLRHLKWDMWTLDYYRNMALFLLADDICVIYFVNTFDKVLRRGPYRELLYAFQHTIMVMLLSIFYLFFTKQGELISRLTIVYTGVIHLVLSYASRMVLKFILSKRKGTKGDHSLILITSKADAVKTIKRIMRNNFSFYNISGLIYTDSNDREEVMGIPVVASFDEAPEYVCHEWVDEVFVVSKLQDPHISEVVQNISETGVTLHMELSGLTHIDNRMQIMEQVAGMDVITTSLGVATTRQMFLKRMFDIFGGLIGSIFTILLTIVIGPIILFSSPGGIFYTQERIGMNGRKFKIIKFRTMYKDADERKNEFAAQNQSKDGKMFKLDFDPRIIGNKVLPDGTHKTGFGHFLRKHSIDEFPQFFNVLIGQMSMVGTRPPTVDEWEKYQLHHRARLSTKPGITGLWQISGRSNITDFEEVVRLDTKYIANWSLGMDINIIFLTIVEIFKGEGAR